MIRQPQANGPMTRAQLRRLQALWHEWAGPLGLVPEADRDLRHYYVERFSEGRAHETRELIRADAARAIAWLERLTHRGHASQRVAAGTAGRHGFPERRRVRPNAAARRALWAVARALGLSRAELDRFIAAHYGSLGLHRSADLHTMADLNRVLWGLKAILRHRQRDTRGTTKRAA